MWFIFVLMAALVLTLIVIGVALVVGVPLLTRASIRFVGKTELTTTDRFALALALLLVLFGAGIWSSMQLGEQNEQRLADQRTELVDQVFGSVSQFPIETFDDPRAARAWELHDQTCDVVEVVIDPDVLPNADRPTTIDTEAQAFESAGWNVSIEALPGQFTATGVTTTFQADRSDGTSVTLEPNANGLVYRVTDHACAESEFAASRN